jgi:hypothetical protein
VAATLRNLLADGFAIADPRRMRVHFHAEAVLQPLERDPQMHLALAPQHDLAEIGVMQHGERRIFIGELAECETQLDVVLAFRG